MDLHRVGLLPGVVLPLRLTALAGDAPRSYRTDAADVRAA